MEHADGSAILIAAPGGAVEGDVTSQNVYGAIRTL